MLKDDKARCVDTYPTRSAYDPREILDPTNEQGGGLFDRGSFNEVPSATNWFNWIYRISDLIDNGFIHLFLDNGRLGKNHNSWYVEA